MLLTLALIQAAAAVPAAPPITLQARFEQGSAALDAGKWADAAEMFGAIDTMPGLSQRSIGIARLRRGVALAHLERFDDASQAIVSGLALTSRQDDPITEFRVAGAGALGEIERLRFDYPAARRSYEQVLTETTDPAYSLAALMALVPITMFDDPAAGLDYANRAVKIVTTNNGSHTLVARAHDLVGRAKLNGGDLPGAIAEMKIALKEAGGLTEHTDTNDVIIRSDLAIANLLAKHDTEARELMAMTGAGRLPNNVFATAAQMDLPPCSPMLRPDDVGVVEFSVGDDGMVSTATPIYASRQGMDVVALAQAVSGWTWRAAEIAKVPAFFRTATRIEIRCSTSVERPSALAMIGPDADRWFASHDIAQGAGQGHANGTPSSLPEQIAAVDKATAAKAPPFELMRLLIQLGDHPAADFATREQAWRKAGEIALAEHAPVSVLALIRLNELHWDDRRRGSRSDHITARLREAARPDVMADARVHATIVLTADEEADTSPNAALRAAIEQVAKDDRLPAKDPLRVAALLRLSTIQARAGNIDAARLSYAATGLNAQQCALVGAEPAMRAQGLSWEDYPGVAYQWGVSGWTRVEFDIKPNGGVVNQRAILSYPPFTFGDAATRGMRNTYFTQTYRPEGGLGCGGASTNVNFLMPH